MAYIQQFNHFVVTDGKKTLCWPKISSEQQSCGHKVTVMKSWRMINTHIVYGRLSYRINPLTYSVDYKVFYK